MKLFSLNTAALALLVLGITGIIVPTGAVPGAETDTVWDEPAITLQPADGPNGKYASIDSDGNLSVDLSGVNPNAVTTVEGVFTITNTESSSRRVWVTHDANETVTLSVGDGRSLENASDPVVLGAGENRTVDLVIDARGRDASETLMTELTLHAERVPAASGPGPAGTPSAPPTTPVATPTPNRTSVSETVEIRFDSETSAQNGTVGIREMNISELENENQSTGPTAVINHSYDGSVEVGRECPCAQDRKLSARGINAITEVGEPVSFAGTRSLIGQAKGVDTQLRIIKLVDISVPEERRGEPATVRITVERSKFEGTDPRAATIGHKTARGWQLLDTRVISSSDQTVTLEARTGGFSAFGVFIDNEVSYEWTLPDGSVVNGRQIRPEFDEPGVYNLTLTVTDSFGRSDSTQYRVLVNDRPEVEIEVVGNVTAGEPATLRANVTDEIGNATVTWTFSDGTVVRGTEVERTFDRGEQVVRVEAEDEFGATGTDEASIVVGRSSTSGDSRVDVIQFGLGFEGRIALVALIAIVALGLFRWLAARRFSSGDEA